MATELRESRELEEAHRKVHAVWQAMAAGWERRRQYVSEFSAGVTDWLIAKLDPQPGQTVLELAAGPGDTGFEAARGVGKRGRVISTDFAADMVEVARRRADELGVTNVEFRVIDAEQNALATDSVDGVICRWGYSLMLDPGRALAETRRVLRDDGRLVLSVVGSASDNPWGSLVAHTIVNLGLIPPVDPQTPGGLFSLANHGLLEGLIERAGFENVQIENMGFRLTFDDFDDYWTFIIEFAGGISILLQSFPDEQRAAVREATEKAVEQFRSGTGYDFPGVTVNAVAS